MPQMVSVCGQCGAEIDTSPDAKFFLALLKTIGGRYQWLICSQCIKRIPRNKRAPARAIKGYPLLNIFLARQVVEDDKIKLRGISLFIIAKRIMEKSLPILAKKVWSLPN